MFQNKGENKSRLCYSLQNHYICIAKSKCDTNISNHIGYFVSIHTVKFNCVEFGSAINPMYCVPKRSDLSLIGSAFEAAGFRCVRIRTECEAEHRTKGGDPRRHGMLVLDGDRVILEVLRSRPTKKDNQLTIPPQS